MGGGGLRAALGTGVSSLRFHSNEDYERRRGGGEEEESLDVLSGLCLTLSAA